MSDQEVPASETLHQAEHEGDALAQPSARRNLVAALLGVAGIGALATLGRKVTDVEAKPDPTPRLPMLPGDSAVSPVTYVTWIGTAPDTTNVNLRAIAGSASAPLAVAANFWAPPFSGGEATDGGGGVFFWDTSSSSGDDGGTIIVPSPNPSPGGRWVRIFDGPLNVRWFGAKGDGTTPDDTAIQAALAAVYNAYSRELRFPPGFYVVSSTLTITPATYCGIILRGEGPDSTRIWYSGTGVAVSTNLLSGFAMSDIAIEQRGTQGTGTGLLLGATGEGSQTHLGELQRLDVMGFDIGIQAGDWTGNTAASEIHYTMVNLTNCNVGWTSQSFNTIDHIFTLSGAAGCGVGFQISVCLAVHFRGGSFSGNGIDFSVGGVGGCVSIIGVDSESCGKFLVTSAAPTTMLYVGHCEVRSPNNTDGIVIDNAGGMSLYLEGNLFGSPFSSQTTRVKVCGPSSGEGFQLVMKSNFICDTDAFFYDASGGIKNMQFDVSMNEGLMVDGLSSGNYFNDESGYYLESVGKVVLNRQVRPQVWPFAGVQNTQALCAVTGISSGMTAANNLCGTTSPLISGSAQTFAVTFTTAEPDASYIVTLTVTDTTPTVTASGARSAYVTNKATTGFTINLEAAPGSGAAVAVDWHLFR